MKSKSIWRAVAGVILVAGLAVVVLNNFYPQKKSLKVGGYPPGDDTDITELLHKQGAIGKTASGQDVKQLYRDSLDEIKTQFTKDPRDVLTQLGDILDEPPGDFDEDKYLAIHTLTKLPLKDSADLLKKEVERDLPPIDRDTSEDDTDYIEAVARKIAAIQALVKVDPEYALDVIADPNTPAAVKRAAVETYILTDADKNAAVAEVQKLLSNSELYMLSAIKTNPPPDVIKNYFLGPPDAPTATATNSTTKTATATAKPKPK